MGVPLNLGEIFSGFLSADAYNANNTLTEEAVGKALDRTGSTDNSMLVDLDMGLNNIFNLKAAILSHQAVPLRQVVDILAASTTDVTSTFDIEDRLVASGGEEVIPLEVITYIPTTNSLMVFKNGDYQRATLEYLETGDEEITFSTPLDSGDIVDIFGARFDASAFVELAQASADFAEAQADRALAAVEQGTQAAINAAEAQVQLAKNEVILASDFADDALGHSNTAESSATTALGHSNTASGFADDASLSVQEALDILDDVRLIAGYRMNINDQTGITYVLVKEDEGDFVRIDNPGANTVVIPNSNVVDFEIGTVVILRQVGAGTTTVAPAPGVTVNAPYNDNSIGVEAFGLALVQVALDEWDLVKSYGGLTGDDLVSLVTEFDARLQDLQVEILSADPTFVVNFQEVINTLDRAIEDFQLALDSLNASVAATLTIVTDRADTLDNSFAQLLLDIDQRFLETSQQFDIFKDSVNLDFSNFSDNVNLQISDLNQDFSDYQGTLNNTVGDLSAAFGIIDADFDLIKPQFDTLVNDFNIIEASFITAQDQFTSLGSRFDTIESQWIGIDQRQQDLEDQLDAIGIGAGSGFESALATNGYQKLPSGLIMQWGTESVGPHRQKRFNFPISFPTAALNIVATVSGAVVENYKTDVSVAVQNLDRTGVTLTSYVSRQTLNMYWSAIGY